MDSTVKRNKLAKAKPTPRRPNIKKVNDFEEAKAWAKKKNHGIIGKRFTESFVSFFKRIKKRRAKNKMARASRQAQRRRK